MMRLRVFVCRASVFVGLLASGAAGTQRTLAQEPASAEQELRRLSAAVDKAQAEVDASQRQLLELKRSLALLQQRLGQVQAPAAAAANATIAAQNPATEEVSENQAMQQAELATLNQIKVESSSKYPVSIHGLLLFNAFVNSSAVDIPLAPSVAFSGAGTAGASLRQTSFGVDARGPTFAGASSHADLDIDFLGSGGAPIAAASNGIVRLRTAHAALNWTHTQAFFQFDRPILNPYSPTSLASNAQPLLAWSGNLWQWVPQAGLTQSVSLGGTHALELSAALIDAPDPPVLTSSATAVAGAAEQSRQPGGELHLELGQTQKPNGVSFGIGGYIGPHSLSATSSYNAWAATLDWRLPLPAGLLLTGNAYRGLALGGLGAGTYKDIVSQQQGPTLFSRPLDDVGGWTQLKKQAGERLEFNAALGLDQAFAKEIASFPLSNSLVYGSFARNRTATGNVIWSPSAYLLFSFEYHRISSYSTSLPVANSNVFGVAAGYKF